MLKTPTMKFYDKGIIRKYPNHTQVAIFSAGNAVLELKIYDDRICKDTFECQTLSSFNAQHLNSNYEDTFIKNLFDTEEQTIIFEDKPNHIMIKIIKD